MWFTPRLFLLLCIVAIALVKGTGGMAVYQVYVKPKDNSNPNNGGGNLDTSGGNSGGAGGSSDGGGDSGGSSGGSSHVSGHEGDHDINRSGNSCVYDLDDTVELCNMETARQKVRFKLIRGPYECEIFVVKERDCLGCKYVLNNSYGQCVDGHQFKHEELIPESKAGCPERRKITRECSHGESEQKQNKGNKPSIEYFFAVPSS